MIHHRSCRISLLTTLVLLLTLVWGALPSVQAGCPGNALPNGDFEAGFSERGSGEVTVAKQWSPWWQDGPDQDKGMNRRPEYKPEDASRYGRLRVREGNFAQKWGNNYATHHGGIYQRIGVPANSQVSVSAWAQAWSSEKDDPKSTSGGTYALSIGLDPTGGTDWRSSNIIWSGRNNSLNTWVEFKLSAQAQGDAVTIYLRGDAEWPVKHNDAYFDDVCLTVSAPPAPTAKPTAVPKPTNPPAPKPSATPEPAPTEAPTAAPAAPAPTATPATGAIRVAAYEDKNGSGLRDADEPLLPNVKLALLNMQRTPVASHTTQSGASEISFDGLAPGNYIVAKQDLDGYVATSPNEWAVAVLAGVDLEVAFGNRAAPPTSTLTAQPSNTPVPTTEAPTIAAPTPVPPPAATSRLAAPSGLLLAALAVLLLVGVRLMRAKE